MRNITAKIIFVLIVLGGGVGCYFVFKYFMSTQGVEAERVSFSDYGSTEKEKKQQEQKSETKKETKKPKAANTVADTPKDTFKEAEKTDQKLTADTKEKSDGGLFGTDFGKGLGSFFNTSTLEIKKPQEKVVTFEAEGSRKDGVLSIDRRNSLFVVTLGREDGVGPGRRLGVYIGDERVATVIVESSSERLSYVRPVGKSLNDFERTQYKVIPE